MVEIRWGGRRSEEERRPDPEPALTPEDEALAEVVALAASPLPELLPGDRERYGHERPDRG